MSSDARNGAFPESLPTSLSDHRSICENDWEAFRSVKLMANHWGRNEWPAGREVYFWYLTFPNQELVDLVENCRARLGLEGIDFVPLDGLHITVLRIGDRDEIAEEDIQAVVDDAKQRLDELEAFKLWVGPLAGSRGAIRLSVSPWVELFTLHQIVRESTHKVLPNLTLAETASFRPHLGIGYSNREQPAEPFIEQVGALRDITPATVEVDAIKLVRLRREPHTYCWEDVATLELKPS